MTSIELCWVERTRFMFVWSLTRENLDRGVWWSISWSGKSPMWPQEEALRSIKEKWPRRTSLLLAFRQCPEPLLAAPDHGPRADGLAPPTPGPQRRASSSSPHVAKALCTERSGFLPCMPVGPYGRVRDEKLAWQGSWCLSFTPNVLEPSFQITGMITAQCRSKSFLKLPGEEPPDYYLALYRTACTKPDCCLSVCGWINCYLTW